MIKYTVELNSIEDFEAWQGGKQMLDLVIEAGKVDELDNLLEELSSVDGFSSDTQLNDFLWFDLENYEGFSYEELQQAIKENNEE